MTSADEQLVEFSRGLDPKRKRKATAILNLESFSIKSDF